METRKYSKSFCVASTLFKIINSQNNRFSGLEFFFLNFVKNEFAIVNNSEKITNFTKSFGDHL